MNDGLLLFDKPYRMTSFDVVRRVRRGLGVSKVGHAGTLDPLATGLLPVLLGKAAPLLRFLPAEPKIYRVVARFGVATHSGDAESEPVEIADPGVAAPAAFPEAVASHEGALTLPVPRFAAVKVDGRPLYRYSRAGEEVALPRRTMRVSRLTSDTSGWPWVSLEMHTSTGTYVRAVVESLGRRVGLPAHVASLRRLRVGAWSVESACTWSQWESGSIPEGAFVPLAEALGLPTLTFDHHESREVEYGRLPRSVLGSDRLTLEAGEPFLLAGQDGSILAVGRSLDDWQSTSQPPNFSYERVLVRPE
jgi:tRNA pseudouridine55 synthase